MALRGEVIERSTLARNLRLSLVIMQTQPPSPIRDASSSSAAAAGNASGHSELSDMPVLLVLVAIAAMFGFLRACF